MVSNCCRIQKDVLISHHNLGFSFFKIIHSMNHKNRVSLFSDHFAPAGHTSTGGRRASSARLGPSSRELAAGEPSPARPETLAGRFCRLGSGWLGLARAEQWPAAAAGPQRPAAQQVGHQRAAVAAAQQEAGQQHKRGRQTPPAPSSLPLASPSSTTRGCAPSPCGRGDRRRSGAAGGRTTRRWSWQLGVEDGVGTQAA